MEYKTGGRFQSDKMFTIEELATLWLEHVYEWMCMKAYGKANPVQGDNPRDRRASTREYWNKAISYFMPSSAHWNDAAMNGNSTKTRKMNQLIAAIKKSERRGQERATNANRAFTEEEYKQLKNLVCERSTLVEARRFQAWIKFQVYQIDRSDCVPCVFKKDLIPSTQFPDFLTI